MPKWHEFQLACKHLRSASVTSSSVASPVVTSSFRACSSMRISSMATAYMAGACCLVSASFPFADCLSVFFGLLVFGIFFWSTRSVFVVWPSLLCGIAYVSKLIRQKWEHCTLPECQPRASRQVSWQPDHILLTSFRKNVHHHREQLRSGRRQTQNYLPWSLTTLL